TSLALSSAERAALSWAMTWVVLTSALFPITSSRFAIYEDTVAYFVTFELLALCAYVVALGSWSAPATLALGAASGMGLLIRPTGVLYVALWGALVALEGRAKRLVVFLAGAAPFVAFWLISNRIRSGAFFALGFPNSTPSWPYNMPIERF